MMDPRNPLGLPPKSRKQSAIDKSVMAISFITAARDAAIERGDGEMVMCAENCLDALVELRLLVETPPSREGAL